MEIKFRVWDIRDKKFVDNIISVSIIYEIVANPDSDVLQHFIIMMFTGLHDKDGEEIYEGDVIVVSNLEFDGFVNSGISESPHERYIDCTGRVSFSEGAFFFDGHSAGEIPLHAIDSDEITVIGNIYEHKHLLS